MQKSSVFMLIVDVLIIALAALTNFTIIVDFGAKLLALALFFLIVFIATLYFKGFYAKQDFKLKDVYYLFEAISVATAICTIPLLLFSFNVVTALLLIWNAICVFALLLTERVIIKLFTNCKKKQKNVLIVGAGQDGKVIAEEIQTRPELGLKVVGFLDDNMNTIEDEDSTIPILGLTCDSEAVIKDNNVVFPLPLLPFIA